MKRRAAPEEFEDGPGPLYASVEAARAKGHEGAKRAARRASKIDPAWRAYALAAVRSHAERNERFLAEHVKRFVTIPHGADARAIGHVMKEAERLGYIRADGFGAAASSHGSAKVAWKSLIYQAKESA